MFLEEFLLAKQLLWYRNVRYGNNACKATFVLQKELEVQRLKHTVRLVSQLQAAKLVLLCFLFSCQTLQRVIKGYDALKIIHNVPCININYQI